MKVCLFDIDGTLLRTGGAGQDAMEKIFRDLFNISQLTGDIKAAGRTDRSIISDLFDQLGIEKSESNWNQFRDAYLEMLPQFMGNKTSLLLPGVRELLDALAERDDVHLGLLTGNFQAGAWIKLKHYEIDHHFQWGGFGDHYYHRDDVAKLAWKEAQEHLGSQVSTDALWVIGDTPADVQCSRAIGATAIAVTTGPYNRESLSASNPDHLWNDLSNPNALLDLLH